MNILLIGNGGREHALAAALNNSPLTEMLFCAPGNPGILTIANHAACDVSSFDSIVQFCQEREISFVVIGPEVPLGAGLANVLRAINLPVFGPTREAAQLECSKGFAKDFMQRYNIPTAAFRCFSATEAIAALEYVREQSLPLVIKADGLAAGKGVIIASTAEEAVSSLNEIFHGRFGNAGNSVVVEDFLRGEEASVFAICDGENFVTLASSQDHKRALDNDQGENTGGMGAYAPAPIVTDEVMEKVRTRIIRPVLDGMKAEGTPFIGCLYVGLMIDNGEPRVVEFNTRFGDPETQAVLTVFRGDLMKLLYSAAIGRLDTACIDTVAEGYACNVVLASEGYPGPYEKGREIVGVHEAEQLGAVVYHAGTAEQDGKLVTAGGRVLGVCAPGATLIEAIELAYAAAERIHFEGKMCRADIGQKGLRG